ncbi:MULTISPECIES: hypothetical protein [unclassified Streptomyces]|uniref:hypothetical protein n=1 Tax=unclassified Streptomyces TaxID=2593676 RepID=UPI0036422551
MSQVPEGDSAFPPSDDGRGGRLAPPAALFGFVLLLVLMFGAAYGVGRAAGPVAPGLHGTGSGGSGGRGGSGDMGGMTMDHGSGG